MAPVVVNKASSKIGVISLSCELLITPYASPGIVRLGVGAGFGVFEQRSDQRSLDVAVNADVSDRVLVDIVRLRLSTPLDMNH